MSTLKAVDYALRKIRNVPNTKWDCCNEEKGTAAFILEYKDYEFSIRVKPGNIQIMIPPELTRPERYSTNIPDPYHGRLARLLSAEDMATMYFECTIQDACDLIIEAYEKIQAAKIRTHP